MVAPHATRELAKSLKLSANLSVDRAGGTSQLGPWSLGLVNCRGGKLVIAVSSTTRWALAVAAAPFASLLPRFGDALLQNLVVLGVPPDRARAEADAHAPLQWAHGHDRGTLAHLSQCTHASVVAAIVGWALAKYVFEFEWTVSLWVPLLGSLAGAVLALAAGWWGLREVLRRPVVETLRRAPQ